jgi:hypothetical protein
MFQIKRFGMALTALGGIVLSATGGWAETGKPTPPKASAAPAPVKWRTSVQLRDFAKTFRFPATPAAAPPLSKTASLAEARAVAKLPAKSLAALSEGVIARAMFVLGREAPAEASAFQRVVAGLPARGKISVLGNVQVLTAFYGGKFDVPCRGKLVRKGSDWPPTYLCTGAAVLPSTPTAGPLSGEPEPLVTLTGEIKVVPPPLSAASAAPKGPDLDRSLAERRKRSVGERDDPANTAREGREGEAVIRPSGYMASEVLAPLPTRFCTPAGSCQATYAALARSIYGRATDVLPLFCAPRKASGQWDKSTVYCSADYFDTLGDWRPWQPSGDPNTTPADLPPFACFGSPHLLDRHFVVPRTGRAGSSGFVCRNRIFQVQVKKAAKTDADVNANIAQQCTELRKQVWGQLYRDINDKFQRWCQKNDPSQCDVPPSPTGGSTPTPPKLLLTREELLYFYGHRELFCRANRDGLKHFLDPEHMGSLRADGRVDRDGWAASFTCDVSRGVVETGPFEEGVQLCALSPFVGEPKPGSLEEAELIPRARQCATSGEFQGTCTKEYVPAVTLEQLRARLHCWKATRPTCSQVSKPLGPKELFKNNILDTFDTLKLARATRNADAWALTDMMQADKLENWQKRFSFQDSSRDEGVYDVKEFCRFVRDTKHIRCGYTRDTIAQWYELRADEEPEGCDAGVCARGAFKRGYYCALYVAKEYFKGRPHWICGIDRAPAGLRQIRQATAVCLGGASTKDFQSPSGDRSSLQCFSRRFRWGESPQSESILRAFDWKTAVAAAAVAARSSLQCDPLLCSPGRPPDQALVAKLSELVKADMEGLVQWVGDVGHTFGHRTSLSKLLLERGPTRGGGMDGDTLAPTTWLQRFSFGPSQNFCYRRLDAPETGLSGWPQTCSDRSQEIANELNGLINDLRTGARVADDACDFRSTAHDGGPRVTTKELGIAFRVNLLMQVLEQARQILLASARDYAKAVRSTARGAWLLSRPELLEAAALDPNANRSKGNVFCAPLRGAGSTPDELVCASSPLLVAGAAQVSAEDAAGSAAVAANDVQKLDQARNRVSFGWCYGGLADLPLHPGPHAAVLADERGELSSPYRMQVPQLVRSGQNAPPLNTTNWLKCASFQYSDAGWQLKPAETDSASAAGPDDDPRVAKGASEVLGFFGEVIMWALGTFSPPDLAQLPIEWQDTWTDRFLTVAKNQWKASAARVDPKAAEVDKAQEAYVRALKNAAAAPPGKLHDDAMQTATAALNTLQDKTAALRAARTAEKARNGIIAGTADLWRGLMDEAAKVVGAAAEKLVEPKVGELMDKVFEAADKLKEVIKDATDSGLAAIPYFGAVLVAAANVAIDMAWDKLKEFAKEQVNQFVTRIFAALLRPLSGQVYNAARMRFKKIIADACRPAEICPDSMEVGELPAKDRWMVACPATGLDLAAFRREAAEAKERLAARTAGLKKEATVWALRFADRALARHGLSLASWKAFAASAPRAPIVARVAEVTSSLRKLLRR